MTDEILGHRPNAVIDLLKERRRSAHRNDGRKLALIIEGGGMRGVLSAGSLIALDMLGFRDCFDEIYATSAGAVNAAYFLTGQGRLGITIYFDSISNRRFYNPLRLSKIVDIGFVYDYVVPHEKTLDEASLRASPTNLYLSVTEVSTGMNVLLDVKKCRAPVATMLKASSALPVLYNKTVGIEGRDYVDGGVSCLLPIEQAASHGCTDALILLTRTRGYELRPPTAFGRLLFYVMIGRRFPALMKAYRSMSVQINRARRIAQGEQPIGGLNIATICPNDAESIVQRTTIDRRRLVEGAALLARKTCRLFRDEADVVDSLFDRYRAADPRYRG